MNDRPSRGELIERKIDTAVAGGMSMSSIGVTFSNMQQVMEFAKMMAISGAAVRPIFRENPGACLAVTLKAAALGFEPFSFASKCYMVGDSGDLAYEAQLIHAIILAKAPLKRRPRITFEGEGQARKCSVTFEFSNGDVDIYESPAFGAIHPKNSPLWKTDPDQQQAYYSVRAGSRRFCPEVILGMYTPEELMGAREMENGHQRSRTDIGEHLATGRRVETVIEADEPTDYKPGDGGGGAHLDLRPGAGPKITSPGPGETVAISVGTPAGSGGTGKPATAPEAQGASTGEPSPPSGATGAAPGGAVADSAVELSPDEKEILANLEKALVPCSTVIEVEVVADEFSGLTENIRAEVGDIMLAKINEYRAKFAPPPTAAGKRGPGRPAGSKNKAKGETA